MCDVRCAMCCWVLGVGCLLSQDWIPVRSTGCWIKVTTGTTKITLWIILRGKIKQTGNWHCWKGNATLHARSLKKGITAGHPRLWCCEHVENFEQKKVRNTKKCVCSVVSTLSTVSAFRFVSMIGSIGTSIVVNCCARRICLFQP